MIPLVFSAAFVGFLHSLAPGHWLPVVLLSKARKWSAISSALGAVLAASGHILISVLLGMASIFAGSHFLRGYENVIEHYGAILLMVFGVAYSAYSYFRHSRCHGHSHHGPELDPEHGHVSRAAVAFLFSLGFSPCIAVLPVFIASSAHGTATTIGAMIAFSFGVLTALVGATLLVALGTAKMDRLLDHPLIEHYGDVIAGAAISIMGIFLLFFPD